MAKQQSIAPEKTVNTKNLRYQRDRDKEIVKGIFRFYEVPGGSMSFVFKQYKEDQVERYDFIDGGVYSIPRAVARHLNKNGWYPQYEHVAGEPGVQNASFGIRIQNKVRRFGFQSLEFTDLDDLVQDGSPIVTAEIVANNY